MRRNGKRSYQKTDREDPGREVVAVSDESEERCQESLAEICGAKVYADSKRSSASMQRT